MAHPYEDLPPRAYWRTGVSNFNPLDTKDFWMPKSKLQPDEPVMTFGSCFAQHLSRALIQTGFSWLNAEEGPPGASGDLLRRYNYGIFSARTGNIYTTKALRQWMEWAVGQAEPPAEVWEQDGRFYDPFRPAIEPGGFSSVDEMRESRSRTLAALRDGIAKCRLFVFTLGLTESWEHREHGYTYATCPGTNAGVFDPQAHVFVNYDYGRIHEDLRAALDIIREISPAIKILLTVSPVPLTATASGAHVLVSTMYSKSVLRAVAGQLADSTDDVDYFPSYEIIAAPPFRGMFYEPNMRSVSPRGVAFVMEHFMAGQGMSASSSAPRRDPEPARTVSAVEDEQSGRDEIVCEEEILEAFAKPGVG